jgi:hypothetical protein
VETVELFPSLGNSVQFSLLRIWMKKFFGSERMVTPKFPYHKKAIFRKRKQAR